MLEGFISAYQVIVDHLHASLEQVCVSRARATERELSDIKVVWLYLPLSLNIIQWHVSFP
jgi:hypothetical protein